MATTMIADGVLIKHYTEGNQGAFETLLKRHKNRIFSSIYALVGDRYIAEDIFQETFIKIIHSIRIGKYNHEDKFLPWAMRISRNMCIDSIRQRKRLPIVVDSEGNDILNNIGIFEKSQEDLHIENDEITMLRKWIWELPEEQRRKIRESTKLARQGIKTLGMTGQIHSEDTKEKMRQKALGRRLPQESIERMARTKRIASVEPQVLLMAQARKGIV